MIQIEAAEKNDSRVEMDQSAICEVTTDASSKTGETRIYYRKKQKYIHLC